MSSITLKTLTPVHVGSGREFMGNFEYLYFEDRKCVAVIDDKKLLQLIGKENIDQWVKVVQQQDDLLDFLSDILDEEITPEMVARPDYIMPVREGRLVKEADKKYGEKAKFPNIRAQIRTGLKGAMIPGSSVKGAVRTAFFTNQLLRNYDKFKDTPKDPVVYQTFNMNLRGKGSKDTKLMKKLVSVDPFHDVFRMWRLSDLIFDQTVCLPTQVLNRKRDGNYILENGSHGRNLQQWIEAIPVGSSSTVTFQNTEKTVKKIQGTLQKRNSDLKKKSKLHKNEQTALQAQKLMLRHLPNFNWTNMVKMINTHTLQLLEDELDYWQDKRLPDEGFAFVDHLKELIEAGEALEGTRSCLLRMGYGSGQKSMTGDWQRETLGKQYDQRSQSLSESDHVPKTRRLANWQPMGFVTLTLND